MGKRKVDIMIRFKKLRDKYQFLNDKRYLNGLDKLIIEEANRLEEEGIFEDKGDFWLIFDTRDYMKLLYEKFYYFKQTFRYGRALNIAEEMLELSYRDNLGIRFHLFSLYAYFENDKILKLHEKFNTSVLELYPVAIYYYKIGDDKNYKKIINKIKKIFPDIHEDVYEVVMNFEEYAEVPAFYSYGDFSEIIELVHINQFLITTMSYPLEFFN